MDPKEQWIKETMMSLDGLRQAKAPEGLQDRIMIAFREGRGQPFLPYRTMLRAAAGIALLVALNIYSMLHSEAVKPDSPVRETQNPIAAEYFNYGTTI